MKIVINNCYGGFGLSHEGVLHYAKLAGITLYPEPSEHAMLLPTYWRVPAEERTGILTSREWNEASNEARATSNKRYKELTLYPADIARDDQNLVATVEQLGHAADGRCAALIVIEIPDEQPPIKWSIEEYDGVEWVAEDHRTWSASQ